MFILILSIHSLRDNKKIKVLEAHDSEIMCLDFGKTESQLILASAGRDRLIHLFEVSGFNDAGNFNLVQTLDEHSSTITSLHFSANASLLISAGADKSCVLRSKTTSDVIDFIDVE